ncbi:hypothetical protein ABSA28_00570 [Candidatus Hepatincolaceae symbiont of Richtersius coronifer]
MDIDFNLLKLLSSRICHDLIGPVGSLNFSMDLLKEDKALENTEAIDIANVSLKNLINKLSFFRMALGAASLGEGDVALNKAKLLIVNLLKEKTVDLKWNKEVDKSLLVIANNVNLKLILNIFLVIFYSVQRNATIKVYVGEVDNKIGVAISVKGNGIKLGIDNIQALRLETSPAEVNPRNVHSYFTALLAKEALTLLEVRDNMQEEIQISCILHKA